MVGTSLKKAGREMLRDLAEPKKQSTLNLLSSIGSTVLKDIETAEPKKQSTLNLLSSIGSTVLKDIETAVEYCM